MNRPMKYVATQPVDQPPQCTFIDSYADHDRKSLLDFADETTMHGMRYVVLPGAKITIKRVLWTFVFALFWVYFISVSIKKVQSYRKYQHITQVDEVSNSLPFPTITICNLNPVRIFSFTKNDLYHAGQMYELLDENMTLIKGLSKNVSKFLSKLANFTNFTPTSFDLGEFQRRAGHKIEDMLIKCKWRDEKCSAKDFTPILTEMGQCYQFNKNPITNDSGIPIYRNVSKGGQGNGLKLLLVTEEEQYLPPNIDKFDVSLESGFKALVHDNDIPPLVQQLGIGLASGLQTFVVLQKAEVKYLGQPWGVCLKSENSPDKIWSRYSDSSCRITCETQHIVKKCKCRFPFMPILKTDPNSNTICTTKQIKDCGTRELENIEDGSACGPDFCIKPCEITRYRSSLSSVKFPSAQGEIKLSDALKKHTEGKGRNYTSGSEKLSDRALVVSIYFQSLSLEKIEQVEAYDFAAMLGDIGGLMGLFIGASAMTLFEFFFFFWDFILLRKKPSNPESNNRQPQMANDRDCMPPGAVDASKFVLPLHNEYNPQLIHVSALQHQNSVQLPIPRIEQYNKFSPLVKRSVMPVHPYSVNFFEEKSSKLLISNPFQEKYC